MSFNNLGLSPALNKALAGQNYLEPYPIQEQAIPAILKGKDVLGIAQTGSGKTLAYALPVLMNLQKKTLSQSRHINVLVLVPTRELAEQVKEVFKTFALAMPERIKTLAVYGGVSINPQMMALQG
nr:DEAD/DEAH box helicase [Bacteroidota bacterium]